MSQKLQSAAKRESGVPAFIQRQFCLHPLPLPQGTDLAGRVVIVTGGNSGVGFEACRQFLRLRPAHLIITVRSQAKGDEAKEKLHKDFPDALVSAWLLDMESYESITAFAKRCETLARIDIVVLNAGVQKNIFELNTDTQHEKTLQVNYLSTALLATLLLPVLKSKKPVSSKPPVLSIVASDTAYWGSIDSSRPIIAQFDNPETFSRNQYQNSKLLLFWFVRKVSELVPSNDIVINLSNPGMTAGTSLNDELFAKFNPVAKGVANRMKKLLARTVEDGATNYIYATVVQGEESHGSFVSDWTIQPYPFVVYGETGEEIKERLWDETMKELEFSGAADIFKSMRG
ncbi:NAD(P)-binding protein [Thozetella sp. PMI_491]|nr:NAD(P)-binding protein [Thozetella sp. PMI_491]